MNEEIEALLDIIGTQDIFIDYNSDEDFWNLPSELYDNTDIEWWHGADKIVLDVGKSVIKIPIKGTYIDIGNGDYTKDEIQSLIKDGFIEKEPEILFYFNKKQNSCLRELSTYQKAYECGLSCFFAAEKIYRQDIIIQDKVIIDNDWDTDENEDEGKIFHINELKNLQKISKYYIPDEIYSNLIDHYGYEKVKDFVLFCNENDINDLDYDNWGKKENGCYIAFDYAGYKSEVM